MAKTKIKKEKVQKPKPANAFSQKEKAKFRSTPDWKDFRAQKIQDANNICDCCGRYFQSPKLHCHHKNLAKEHYTDISDKTHFSILCSVCHDTVHWAHTLTVSKKNPTTNKLIIDLQKSFFI